MNGCLSFCARVCMCFDSLSSYVLGSFFLALLSAQSNCGGVLVFSSRKEKKNIMNSLNNSQRRDTLIVPKPRYNLSNLSYHIYIYRTPHQYLYPYPAPPQEPLLALCLCGVVVLSLLPKIGVAALLRVVSRSATYRLSGTTFSKYCSTWMLYE
jgi:hypothetical protein